MAVIQISYPTYLVPHVHPGLEIPKGTIAKAISAARNLTHRVNPQEWNLEFRRNNFHIFDANPEEVHLEDPERYEAACQEAFSNVDRLGTLNVDELTRLVCRLNGLICQEQNPGYRQGMMAIFTHLDFEETWASADLFRAFIQRHDPNALPWFENYLFNENLRFAQELVKSDSYDPILESRVLSEESKQQLKKYATLGMAPQHIPGKMRQFLQELRSMLRREDTNPFELAAFVHMRIVQIHPFVNGNGRLARLLMNVVLKKYGYPPIYFYSESEYTREVLLGRKEIHSFAEFISRKVCFFQQLQKTAKQMHRSIQQQQRHIEKSGIETCTFHLHPLAKAFLEQPTQEQKEK